MRTGLRCWIRGAWWNGELTRSCSIRTACTTGYTRISLARLPRRCWHDVVVAQIVAVCIAPGEAAGADSLPHAGWNRNRLIGALAAEVDCRSRAIVQAITTGCFLADRSAGRGDAEGATTLDIPGDWRFVRFAS